MIFKLFEKALEPVVLVDANAIIVWYNQAAQSLFEIKLETPELGDIFPSSIVQEILGCEHFTVTPLDWLKQSNKSLPYSAIITCLAGNDPDDDMFLIMIKPSSVIRAAFLDREDSPTTLAHDLKNPLGAIFGYADALLDTPVGSGLSEKQRDIVARVRSTAARSIELVRNLQHLSQMNSSSSRQASAFDLNSAIETVLHHTWRENPNEPKVNVNLHSGPLPVLLDRIALDRVLTNLYSNALKFTPPDGKILIRTWQENGKAHLSVTNSAPLIPKEEINSIFNRHFRGSTSKGTGGSGLGLYIVQQIMQRAGGSIEATSQAPIGTTFTISLPNALSN